MTAPDPNALLMGGGTAGKSASFPTLGATITGVIVRPPETRQQIDPQTEKPKYWDDGNPMWQIVVPLQTEERSPEIEDDDGLRYLYLKGSKKPESRSLLAAVSGAIGAAKASGLEVGGQLTVTYVADGVKLKAAFNAPKQYEATYTSAANVALAPTAGATTQAAAAHVATAPNGDEPPAHVDASIRAAWANLPEQTKAMFRQAS